MANTYQTYYNQNSNKTCILFRARHFLPSQTVRSLYYSLIYPYLNYGNMIWANTYPSRLESIRKLHKKINVRAISFSDPRDRTRPIFENLSILPIDDLNRMRR